MVILVAAEQCGEQFSVLCADCRLELAHYPVKMEREMCILTAFPICPHLFRCLILTGNLSRGVSPPSDYSAGCASLPSGLACLPGDTTGDRERFTTAHGPAGPPRAFAGAIPQFDMGYALPARLRRSWPFPRAGRASTCPGPANVRQAATLAIGQMRDVAVRSVPLSCVPLRPRNAMERIRTPRLT